MTRDRRRYKVILAYNGSNYHGFQSQTPRDGKKDGLDGPSDRSSGKIDDKQPKRKRQRIRSVPMTVQQAVEDAMIGYGQSHDENFSRQDLALLCSSRTDTGVHAKGQVLALTLPSALDQSSPLHENLDLDCYLSRRSINSRLPKDVSVTKMFVLTGEAATTFNPRVDAKKKQYSYTIRYRRKVSPTDKAYLSEISENKCIRLDGPNTLRTALDAQPLWVCPWALDDERLGEWCSRLSGTHDYSAFVHKDSRREKSNEMEVHVSCQRTERSDGVVGIVGPTVECRLLFQGKGFRYNMVRNLVGFLVDLCRGAVTMSIWDEIFSGTDEVAARVHNSPAGGLCLEYVEF